MSELVEINVLVRMVTHGSVAASNSASCTGAHPLALGILAKWNEGGVIMFGKLCVTVGIMQLAQDVQGCGQDRKTVSFAFWLVVICCDKSKIAVSWAYHQVGPDN